jgi:Ras family
MYLVGNKNDRADERCVSTLEGQQFASNLDIAFLETSAKDNLNVEEVCGSDNLASLRNKHRKLRVGWC